MSKKEYQEKGKFFSNPLKSKLTGDGQKELKKWQDLWAKKSISNYEYLMRLNNLAARSFNNLSQYPVMPWILALFMSKEMLEEEGKDYQEYVNKMKN